MLDTIINGTRTSRSILGNLSIPEDWALARAQLVGEGWPIDLGQLNDAGLSQRGTDLNKRTLLKDTTAALYGKGSDAVPDDILAAIYSSIYGSDNVTYRWSRHKTVYSAVVSETINEGANIFAGTSDNVYVLIKYSGSVTFDENNNLVLQYPLSFSKKYSDFSTNDAPNLAGYYFTVQEGNILFGRAGVRISTRSSGGDYYVRVSNFSSVSKKQKKNMKPSPALPPTPTPSRATAGHTRSCLRFRRWPRAHALRRAVISAPGDTERTTKIR